MAAKESKHPVLPKLKKNRQIAGFGERGKWSARESAELGRLSDDLDVARVGIDINSIPDMWARPLLFEMALYDADHLLKQRVLGEWRGLLAMLALKEVAGLDKLTVLPTSVPQSKTEEETEKPLTADPDFLGALARLIPTPSLSSDTTWHELYLFLYDDQPIGMTSPTTLVVTATDYYGRIDPSQVPWFNGKLLTDPTGKAHDPKNPQSRLSRPAGVALAGWLNDVLNQLRDPQSKFDAQSSRGNALVTRIQNYINDVGQVNQVISSAQRYGMTSGIFSVLDRPVKGGGGVPQASHVLLVSSRKQEWIESQYQASPEKTKPTRDTLEEEAYKKSVSILVIDEQIAKQWKRDGKDLLVWGTNSLQKELHYAGLPDKPPATKTQYIGVNGQKAEIWSPKWFFKERLYVVRKANAFPKSVGINLASSGQDLTYGNEVVTPILPFDQVLIDQLTVDDLATKISFEQRSEGILVGLEITLSGPEGIGESFQASRLYRFDENQISVLEDVPLLAIWPDFRATAWGWKAYYSYYDTAGARETFIAKPYCSNSESEERPLSTGGDITRRITRTDSYPEAMLCSVKTELQDIGFLLIQQPLEAVKADIPYQVGIDFGATGTNIYFKAGEQPPKPFNFHDRFGLVTAITVDRLGALYDNSLPAATEKTPFLSIFKTFAGAESQNLRPLLDGIIYFPRGGQFTDDPLVTYNLKWSGREEDTYKVEAFLEQTSLQIAAEAVNSGVSHIKWCYSFPSAFSKTRRKTFRDIWAAVVDRCGKLTGVKPKPVSPVSETESKATALYFRDPGGHNASTPTGAVCIDIGGSTSDIAIWQREMLCWQTSLRFAGRDLFLNFLFSNPEFLGQIRKVIDTKKLQEAKDRGQISFYAQADALLREEGEALFESLPHVAEQPQMAKLVQVLSLGIAGIFYYVGLLVKYLRDQGRYSLEVPKFYIGGNGSLIFRWLNIGKPFDSEASASEVFKTVFLRASGLAQRPLTIEISHHPKAEAAYGLICGTQLQEEPTADYGVLAGESFVLNAQDKPWNKLINAQSFQRKLSAPKKLDQISDFLVAFDQAARQTEIRRVATGNEERERLLKEVRISLANAIEDAKRLGEDGIGVEPIFILALKSLLRFKIERS
jgi:hypothetical protein